MADIEERTAWYRRKPMLLFFLIFTVVLFLIALISNFIPQVSYDSNVDKDGGTLLLVFQILTTIIGFVYVLLMAFRWFVNIFTHKSPTMLKIAVDIIYCTSALILTIGFLLFGSHALRKAAYWAFLNVIFNVNELIIHLTHRRRASHGEIVAS